MKNLELIRAFIKNAIDGIITVTEHGIIESFNPSAGKLFGYNSKEVVGKNISLLMPLPQGVSDHYFFNRHPLELKKKTPGGCSKLIGRHKNGHTFPFKLAVGELIDDGQTFYVGFIHDLSEQKLFRERLEDYAAHLEEVVDIRTESLKNTIHKLKKAEKKLSRSLRKEQEVSKLKSRFVSMASHEFRTPLSTIQLSASLISSYIEKSQVDDANRHLEKIKNCVLELTSILTEFLQLENLESGTLVTKYSSFNVAELAYEITEEMRMQAKSGQRIVHRHSGGDFNIVLDKNLIKNCIVNLITNSIKYSGDAARIEFVTEVSDNYVITVKDDGIGIPKEDQEHLFDAFFRAHNTGDIPGTGLGLNIVSRYVDQMKGNIDFSSDTQGTSFTLTFPKHEQSSYY